MKKTIVFALRCMAVTLLVAWLAGMAIPYKLTCSGTWARKSAPIFDGTLKRLLSGVRTQQGSQLGGVFLREGG